MIKPMADMVVIEPILESKESGGIAIPEQYRRESSKGKVVAAGDGVVRKNGKKLPMYLDVGDEVLYPIYMGQDFEWAGKTFRLVHERDILGLFVKKKIILRHDQVLLRKCIVPDVDIGEGKTLHIPDDSKEDTWWCEIVDVGHGCKYLAEEHIGQTLLAPDDKNEITRCMLHPEDPHLWFMSESGWEHQVLAP